MGKLQQLLEMIVTYTHRAECLWNKHALLVQYFFVQPMKQIFAMILLPTNIAWAKDCEDVWIFDTLSHKNYWRDLDENLK